MSSLHYQKQFTDGRILGRSYLNGCRSQSIGACDLLLQSFTNPQNARIFSESDGGCWIGHKSKFDSPCWDFDGYLEDWSHLCCQQMQIQQPFTPTKTSINRGWMKNDADCSTPNCYVQLRLSHDSWESSLVDSRASWFGSLWRHGHVPCTHPFILSLCVLNACLVLKPTFS